MRCSGPSTSSRRRDVTELQTTLAIAASAVTLTGAVVGAGGWAARRMLRPLVQMAEDWTGEPERPGVDRRPGVMERLSRIEHAITDHVADGHGGALPAPHGNSRPQTPVDARRWP